MNPIRVMSVTSVALQLRKSQPPQLVISVTGKVPTSGWKNGELLAWRYAVAPADGIQDFEFVATPPEGIVLTVVSPICAELDSFVDVDNYWGPEQPLRGVRVHARENSVETLLANAAVMEVPLDNPVPWPWLSLPSLPGSLDLLLGKTLRAYHTGDALTKDYRPDRANIELGAGERIVRVWFG